ncbi:MAG: iron-containing alcohol dehydrogenase [Phycisphaeraceae bacterium]
MQDILQFKMSGSLRFGAGALAQLPDELARFPEGPMLIVTDPGIVACGLLDTLRDTLAEVDRELAVFDQIEPDPSVETAAACAGAAKQAGAAVLIGFGGGSSIDMAKVAAVLATHGGSPLDYAGIGQVPEPGLPVVAVPTTAGTGSEVTPIAVLSDKAAHLKKGIVSDHLYPALALVDPELMAGLPPKVTAYTGMDALTHCIEAYTNRFSHPFIDAFAERGIRLIGRSIRRAWCDGSHLDARSEMAMGSLYGGLCLGSVNTAAVHALAYPLGGTFNIPHGLANTLLLPHVMAVNLVADLAKYARVAELLGEPVEGLSQRDAALASVEAVRQLAADLGMDLRLREFGIEESDIPAMAEGAMKVTRLMNNNPRCLTEEDCAAIYQAAY